MFNWSERPLSSPSLIMHPFRLWVVFFVNLCPGILTLQIAAKDSDSPSRNGPSCSLDCSTEKYNPVCGTNGRTYDNRCSLDKNTICQGITNVKFQYRGACAEEEERCLDERSQALRNSNASGIPMFVPVCHDDGSYAEVQCHYGTGYCWCVNEDGKPIPRTSIRYDRPNCKREKRKRNRRGKGKKRKNRNKSRKTSNRESNLESSSKRQCAQNDRKEFNQNILESLAEEFGKHHSRSLEPEGLIGDQKKEVIEWKFDQMDANRDGDLRKREFKTFRLAIKRLARNKFCARNFWQYCDLDDDKRMTRSEWGTCLGVEINISFSLFLSLNSEEDKAKRRAKGQKRNNSDEPEQLDDEAQGSTSEGWVVGSALTKSSVNAPASLTSTIEERINCWVEHRAAIESSKDGGVTTYIPECKPDGRFQSVQCYKTSGYCWCVEELTGRPIPGTSRQNQTPTCAPGSTSSSSSMIQKEWVKCPGNRRRQFREHLMDHMTKQMVESSKDHDMSYLFNEQAAELSLEERVGKWQFLALDKNRDGVLNRREIRPFRKVLKEDRRLRLCGKRIQNHCDPDSDENITFKEWEFCIGLRGETVQIPLPRIDPANRKGPNPLKTWLKAD